MTHTIHMSVPRHLKARWVALSNKAPEKKLGEWIIKQVTSTIGTPLKGTRSTISMFAEGEKPSTIIIPVEASLKDEWIAISRQESLRLTDWIVNRVELSLR